MFPIRIVGWCLRRILCCGNAGKLWLMFLSNRREAILAMDLLDGAYRGFLKSVLLLEHKILHFNVASHPSSEGLFSNCARYSRRQPGLQLR